MGEYYVVANLDRSEYLSGSFMGISTKFDGLLASPLPKLLAWLLASTAYYPGRPELRGSWAGNRVVIAGDEGPSQQLWEQARAEFADITLVTLEAMAADCASFFIEYSEMGLLDDCGRFRGP